MDRNQELQRLQEQLIAAENKRSYLEPNTRKRNSYVRQIRSLKKQIKEIRKSLKEQENT